MWRFQGVNLAWGMLSLYFASSAAVCCIGLYGIIKVRLTTCYPHLGARLTQAS